MYAYLCIAYIACVCWIRAVNAYVVYFKTSCTHMHAFGLFTAHALPGYFCISYIVMAFCIAPESLTFFGVHKHKCIHITVKLCSPFDNWGEIYIYTIKYKVARVGERKTIWSNLLINNVSYVWDILKYFPNILPRNYRRLKNLVTWSKELISFVLTIHLLPPLFLCFLDGGYAACIYSAYIK